VGEKVLNFKNAHDKQRVILFLNISLYNVYCDHRLTNCQLKIVLNIDIYLQLESLIDFTDQVKGDKIKFVGESH
jgi:hypothetical protein